jgi:hypothetical protein
MGGMRNVLLLGAALGLASWVSAAGAQERSETLPPRADGLRVGGGLVTGFAGTLEVDAGGTFDLEDDLEPSIGFDAFVEYAFMRYLAFGGWTSFVWWNADVYSDADIGRSFYWTLDAFAKARYPFAIGDLGAEPYLVLPLGLVVSAPNGDLDVNVAAGFNIAIMGGFALWFTDSIGAYTQIGWQWLWAGHENDAGGDFNARIGQLRWTLGVTLAL